MSAEQLNIGWERCRVFDDNDVRRYFKCKWFNHSASKCKNREMYVKYYGNHKSKECEKEPISNA